MVNQAVLFESQREGRSHIFLCAPAQSTFRCQTIPVFSDSFQDIRRHSCCVLGADLTIRCDLQRKVKGDRRFVLIYTEGQLVTFRDRVYIVQGREMPAIRLEDKAMIPHVVIRIGNSHVEHDPLPQLRQISLGSSTVGLDKGHQLKITGLVRRRSPICFPSIVMADAK